MAGLANGARRLFPDSRLGLLVGFVVTQAAMGVVEWAGTIDFSTLPTWAATTAALLVGYGTAALTAWAAKRDPKGTTSSTTTTSPGDTL